MQLVLRKPKVGTVIGVFLLCYELPWPKEVSWVTETKLNWWRLECQDCLLIFYKPIGKGNLSNLSNTSTNITQGVNSMLTDEKSMTCSFSQDLVTSQHNFSSVEKSTVMQSSQGMVL